MKEPKFVGEPKFVRKARIKCEKKIWNEAKIGDEPKFVGLDLAKRTMEVCILCDGEKTQRYSGVSTGEAGREKLAGMLRAGDTVGMEACTYAFVLARYLRQKVGCKVYVLNPGKLAMIWKSTRKTDKEDARKIAQFIQRYPEEELPVVEVPSEEEEKFRNLVSMKGFVTRQRTQSVNRLHALYVQAGITDMKKSNLAKAKSRQEQRSRLPESLCVLATLLEQEIELYEKQLGELEEQIEQKIRSHELAPYIMSVPGVGMGLAAAFLAYVGDGKRFSKPSEVANYAGLVPRLDCSGDSDRYGHITKAGCRPLRAVILQASWALLRSKEGGRLRAKFFLLNERMGKTKSAVAIARRLLCLLWILATRREFYADMSQEGLQKRLRYYKIPYEGRGLAGDRIAS
jgi:transposase